MKLNTGIYAIQNIKNGKQYIGSAVNILGRFKVHKHYLKNKAHSNIRLQRSWEKYGEQSFKFKILLFCDVKNLLFYEQRAIDAYSSIFNICPIAGNNYGLVWGEHCNKGRKNISESNSGRVPWNKGKTGIYSKETLERMSVNGKGKPSRNKGRKFSVEHREKLSKAKIGIKRGPISEETKRKMSAAQKGKILSLETIARMSAAKKGKYIGIKNHFYGKTHSEEVRKKIKESRALQTFSEETRKKLSISIKNAWRKRKEIGIKDE